MRYAFVASSIACFSDQTREVFSNQRLLRIARSSDGVRSGMERRAKSVAHQLEHVAAMMHDRIVDDLLVPFRGA